MTVVAVRPVSSEPAARSETISQRAVGWALALCLTFWAMKLYLIGWFLLSQRANPLFEAPIWAWPLIGGADLAICFVLAATYAITARAVARIWGLRALPFVSIGAWIIGAVIVLFSVISLQVNQTYSSPLEVKLVRWMGDPRVFFSSISGGAGLATPLIALICIGGQRPASKWIVRRLCILGWLQRPSAFWGFFMAAAVISGSLWQRCLGGMDTLGVKQNPLLYFVRHWESARNPGDARQLASELQSAAEPWDQRLRRASSLIEPAARPRDFQVRPLGSRCNFVLIQLESTSAAHIDSSTTPNLMRLAENGVSFADHFTTFSLTDMATYSLYYSDYMGDLKGQMESFYGAPLKQASLADVLHQGGFSVGLFHSGFLSYMDLGYCLPEGDFDAREDAATIWDGAGKLPWSWGVREEQTVARMLQWIDNCPRQRRFAAMYLTMYPHHPYWSPVEGPFPKNSWLDRYRNALCYVDQQVGRIADHLRETGRLEDTVFVIFGDHGESVSQYPVGHGIRLSMEELKTPLIISNPALFPTRQTSGEWTNHLDIAPTVAVLAGLSVPDGWSGRDLLAGTFEPRLLFASLNFARLDLIIDNGVLHSADRKHGVSSMYRVRGDSLEPDSDQTLASRYGEIRDGFDAWVLWSHARRAAANQGLVRATHVQQ